MGGFHRENQWEYPHKIWPNIWDYVGYYQWEFQEPKLVPIIILGLLFRPKFQGISPQFIWPKIWYTRTSMYWILKFPLRKSGAIGIRPGVDDGAS